MSIKILPKLGVGNGNKREVFFLESSGFLSDTLPMDYEASGVEFLRKHAQREIFWAKLSLAKKALLCSFGVPGFCQKFQSVTKGAETEQKTIEIDIFSQKSWIF